MAKTKQYQGYVPEAMLQEAKTKRERILEIGKYNAYRAMTLAGQAKNDYAHSPSISQKFGRMFSRYSAMVQVGVS